ncbi:hypothetical protein Pmani_020374 [Petrolisthes manimaculis]|uniref:Pentraxin (PTX) domain-containing protein n=1 Tax=Petrolisthes manimaculis TaxID=1843537 RepID=A0AAE1U4H8_9EUCA|nr:hypothetical protein Pmani_020374 [Petrolisthes manimaculis]
MTTWIFLHLLWLQLVHSDSVNVGERGQPGSHVYQLSPRSDDNQTRLTVWLREAIQDEEVISRDPTLVNSLSAFTLCLWFRVVTFLDLSCLLSYALSAQDDDVIHIFTRPDGLEVDYMGHNVQHHLKLWPMFWYSACLVVDEEQVGVWVAGRGQHHPASNPPLLLNGSLVAGQEQDELDGGFIGNQAFIGHLTGLTLWPTALSPHQRSEMVMAAPSEEQEWRQVTQLLTFYRPHCSNAYSEGVRIWLGIFVNETSQMALSEDYNKNFYDFLAIRMERLTENPDSYPVSQDQQGSWHQEDQDSELCFIARYIRPPQPIRLMGLCPASGPRWCKGINFVVSSSALKDRNNSSIYLHGYGRYHIIWDKRCDNVIDCSDGIDEMDCFTCITPQGYVDAMPPMIPVVAEVTDLGQTDLLASTLTLIVTLMLSWIDERLEFHHLQNDTDGALTTVVLKLDQKVWMPRLRIKRGSLKEETTTTAALGENLWVRRQGEGTVLSQASRSQVEVSESSHVVWCSKGREEYQVTKCFLLVSPGGFNLTLGLERRSEYHVWATYLPTALLLGIG